MRVLIAIVMGVLVGLGVRAWKTPAVQEVVAPAPSYAESHAAVVQAAEEKVLSQKPVEPPAPLNPAYPEPLSVRGYIVLGKRVNVLLSDGTVWTETTGGLERIERAHVAFRGKIYAIRGSGAMGAPVRPDTEVPAVAVAGQTGRNAAVVNVVRTGAAVTLSATPPRQ